METTQIFFYVFSALAVIFSLMVVLSRRPVSSAFSLVLVFFCLAANYVLLSAHFLAALQILVYAGAIMVLFVFVIMLLNAHTKNLEVGKSLIFQAGSAVLCTSLFGMFFWSIRHGSVSATKLGMTPEKVDQLGGNVQVLSELMFSDYILPFELTSVLLLVGIAGSVALAKRKLEK